MSTPRQSDNDTILRLGAIVLTCQDVERNLKITLPFVTSEDPSLGAALMRLEKLGKRTLGELAGKLMDSSSSDPPNFSQHVECLVNRRNQVLHHFNEAYGSQMCTGSQSDVIASVRTLLADLTEFRSLAEKLARFVLEGLRDVTFLNTPEYEQMASLRASFRQRVSGQKPGPDYSFIDGDRSFPMTEFTIEAAQADMRRGYMFGAPGVLVSGSVWLVAAVVAMMISAQTAVLTLLAGGALIFPISMLLTKLLGISGKHTAGNQLGTLAGEGTFWLLAGCAIAYGMSVLRIEWFFPAMMLVIGGRYLTFQTLYGLRVYWMLGALLGAVGLALALIRAQPVVGAFAGAAIELVFAAVLLVQAKRGASE